MTDFVNYNQFVHIYNEKRRNPRREHLALRTRYTLILRHFRVEEVFFEDWWFRAPVYNYFIFRMVISDIINCRLFRREVR